MADYYCTNDCNGSGVVKNIIIIIIVIIVIIIIIIIIIIIDHVITGGDQETSVNLNNQPLYHHVPAS